MTKQEASELKPGDKVKTVDSAFPTDMRCIGGRFNEMSCCKECRVAHWRVGEVICAHAGMVKIGSSRSSGYCLFYPEEIEKIKREWRRI